MQKETLTVTSLLLIFTLGVLLYRQSTSNLVATQNSPGFSKIDKHVSTFLFCGNRSARRPSNATNNPQEHINFCKVSAVDKAQCTDHPVTIVSAVLDIGREKWDHYPRDFADYMQYGMNLLQLNVPIVVFVEEKYEELIWQLRKDKEPITKVVGTTLRELPMYQRDYERVKEIMTSAQFKKDHMLINHPEEFSPEYNILMSSKLDMLQHAVANNYFTSLYFFWMDFGYGHGNKTVFPKSKDWIPRQLIICDDKITYIELHSVKTLNDIYDIYKKWVAAFLNGGFFGGSMSSIKQYYKLYSDTWKSFLDEGMMDDDQTLALECYFRKPSLFNLVKGDWDDAFRLFS